MELRSEFAAVDVQIDQQANGPRLRVTDEETGLVAFLDPVALQSLTWLTPEQLERVVIEARQAGRVRGMWTAPSAAQRTERTGESGEPPSPPHS